MAKPIKQYRLNRRRSWLLLSLAVLFIYLAYYQLWYHSPHVDSNIFRLHKVLNAHLSDIWTAKFSPDGNRIASGSVDSTIKIGIRKTGNLSSASDNPRELHLSTLALTGIILPALPMTQNSGSGNYQKDRW
jgi:WD40 repeat protein